MTNGLSDYIIPILSARVLRLISLMICPEAALR
jgi:hypothetical protein